MDLTEAYEWALHNGAPRHVLFQIGRARFELCDHKWVKRDSVIHGKHMYCMNCTGVDGSEE